MKYQPPSRRRTSPRRGRGPDCRGRADVLSACGGGGDTGTPGSRAAASGGGGGEEVAVTLITKTSTNPFFIAMQKGAEEAGKANNVSITTAAGKEDGDEATQIAGHRGRRRPRRQGHPDHAGHRRGEPGDRAGPRRRPVRDRAGHPAEPAGHRRHHLRHRQLQGR